MDFRLFAGREIFKKIHKRSGGMCVTKLARKELFIIRLTNDGSLTHGGHHNTNKGIWWNVLLIQVCLEKWRSKWHQRHPTIHTRTHSHAHTCMVPPPSWICAGCQICPATVGPAVWRSLPCSVTSYYYHLSHTPPPVWSPLPTWTQTNIHKPL